MVITPQEIEKWENTFQKVLYRRFSYSNVSPDYQSFLLSSSSTLSIAAGATTTVIEYKPQRGRFAGIVSFQFGFKTFTPIAGSFAFNFTYDRVLVPNTDGEGQLDINNFLNEEIPYFIYIDEGGKHLLKLEVTNNGVVTIFPFLRVRGFYLHSHDGISSGERFFK